jgi:hypothetical protein
MGIHTQKVLGEEDAKKARFQLLEWLPVLSAEKKAFTG